MSKFHKLRQPELCASLQWLSSKTGAALTISKKAQSFIGASEEKFHKENEMLLLHTATFPQKTLQYMFYKYCSGTA